MNEGQVEECRRLRDDLAADGTRHLGWRRIYFIARHIRITLALLRLICTLADEVAELKTACAELRDGV